METDGNHKIVPRQHFFFLRFFNEGNDAKNLVTTLLEVVITRESKEKKTTTIIGDR